MYLLEIFHAYGKLKGKATMKMFCELIMDLVYLVKFRKTTNRNQMHVFHSLNDMTSVKWTFTYTRATNLFMII